MRSLPSGKHLENSPWRLLQRPLWKWRMILSQSSAVRLVRVGLKRRRELDRGIVEDTNALKWPTIGDQAQTPYRRQLRTVSPLLIKS